MGVTYFRDGKKILGGGVVMGLPSFPPRPREWMPMMPPNPPLPRWMGQFTPFGAREVRRLSPERPRPTEIKRL